MTISGGGGTDSAGATKANFAMVTRASALFASASMIQLNHSRRPAPRFS
jgi:hypothetical protein